MHKLSIQTLTGKPTDSHKNISVGTLTKISRDISDINTDLIFKSIQSRRDKKLEIYMRHYHCCFEQIKVLNNQYKTDMIYSVPLKYKEILDYNSVECCLFLEKKMTEKFFDVLRLDNNSIFITWKFIEQNKDNKNNKHVDDE